MSKMLVKIGLVFLAVVELAHAQSQEEIDRLIQERNLDALEFWLDEEQPLDFEPTYLTTRALSDSSTFSTNSRKLDEATSSLPAYLLHELFKSLAEGQSLEDPNSQASFIVSLLKKRNQMAKISMP